MNSVFVLSADKKPLDPTHPARARKLLNSGRAAMFKMYPFTIIIKDIWSFTVDKKTYRLKIDPGSKYAGFAIVCEETSKIVWAAELTHRGSWITKKMLKRSGQRRGRRSRKIRYRKPRFDNRTRPDGWLPPSLMHRPLTIMTLVNRLLKLCPISAISVESNKFDTQKMMNPDIESTEYQQGPLYKYERKEFLLEKYDRKCVYCKKAGSEASRLEVEHVIPKSRGGSNRISNLVTSCRKCNEKKGNQTAEEFGFPDIQKTAMKHGFMKHVAVTNSIRNMLYKMLKETGLRVESGSAAVTKYNRTRLGFEKAHWIDAACVGMNTPDNLSLSDIVPLKIKAVGHGTRRMTQIDKDGFPVKGVAPKSGKMFFGFQTHDIVKAQDTGEICKITSVRAKGSFSLNGKLTKSKTPKKLELIQGADGYSYSLQAEIPLREGVNG